MTLRRRLGPVSAVLITVGAMVGSGVFVTPHDVALRVGSPWWTVLLWFAGGVLAWMGALSFVELGAAIPETGGLYVYLRRAYGPAVAFAFAWAMLVVLVPSSVGFFAQVAARHLVVLSGGSSKVDGFVALGIVTALVLANLRGVQTGAAVQNVATVLKFVGVFVLALLGLVVEPDPRAKIAAPTGGVLSLLAALVPVLWAYDGWIDVTSVAGEVRDPVRDIPRALTLGTVLVTVLYLLVNVGYLRVLGPVVLAESPTPAADAAARFAGATGRAAVSALVAVATLGGCAVGLLTGSRVVYAVANDGLFFRAFAHTSFRGVPDVAVAVTGALAVVYVVSPLGHLGEMFVVGAWPFYALGAMAAVVLRRKEPALRRPYRAVGYPYVNVLFAAGSLAVVVGYAVSRPVQTSMSLGVIALGWLLCVVKGRWRREPKG